MGEPGLQVPAWGKRPSSAQEELSSWDGSPQGLGRALQGSSLLRRGGWTLCELRLQAGSDYLLVTKRPLCQLQGMLLPDCVARAAWHSSPVVAKSSPRCREDRCPCTGRPPWLLPHGWLASLQPWAGEPPRGSSWQSSRAAPEVPLLLWVLWRHRAQGDAPVSCGVPRYFLCGRRLGQRKEWGALPVCFVGVLLI